MRTIDQIGVLQWLSQRWDQGMSKKIEECKNYTCWLVARGFVNNISSSTMCFSVAQILINETAQYLASEPVSEPVSDPVSP